MILTAGQHGRAWGGAESVSRRRSSGPLTGVAGRSGVGRGNVRAALGGVRAGRAAGADSSGREGDRYSPAPAIMAC